MALAERTRKSEMSTGHLQVYGNTYVLSAAAVEQILRGSGFDALKEVATSSSPEADAVRRRLTHLMAGTSPPRLPLR